MVLANLIKAGIRYCKSHPSQVYAVASSGCIVLSGIFAFRAGTKASRILDKHREDFNMCDPYDKAAKRQVIKETILDILPSLLPAIAFGSLGIACNIGGHISNMNKIASLTSIASVAANQLSDVNTELKEKFSENKVKAIQTEAAQRRFRKDKPNDGDEIKYLIETGGDVPCTIPYMGTYFCTTYDKVNRAIQNMAYQCAESGEVTLADLYLKLGLKPKGACHDISWNEEDLEYSMDNFGTPIPKLPMIRTTTLMEFDDKPWLAIIFDKYHVKEY